jgi:DNA-binding IclR family transcriptional regulator
MDVLYARAMGKAILANLEPVDLTNILEKIQIKKLTSNTLHDKEKILKDIELTRNRGYSINNDRIPS